VRKLVILVLSTLVGAVVGFTQGTTGTPGLEVKPSVSKVTPPQHKGGNKIAETNTVGSKNRSGKKASTSNGKHYSQSEGKSGNTPPPKSTSTSSSPTKTN
jgi:hypothetical protein